MAVLALEVVCLLLAAFVASARPDTIGLHEVEDDDLVETSTSSEIFTAPPAADVTSSASSSSSASSRPLLAPPSSASPSTSIVLGSSKRLADHLLSRHNRNAPPDGLVDVHYEMELVHILGIDELKQTMTALVYVDERWIDPSLAWNPEHYGGLSKTWLPTNTIWMPDILIFNMLQHEDLLSSVRAPVLVYANGTVEASHPAVYTVMCEINIKDFPLDEQKCTLEVASWAYGREKLRMRPHMEHSGEHYSENEEWRLLRVNVSAHTYDHEGTVVSELSYEVYLLRRPLFYMVTLTFPSYVMCAISIVGLFARFSTKDEREERFTLGVTAILTMAVLSLVVSEKVPHSSTSVPLLVVYFLFNMVAVSVAAMFTGLVMNVHRRARAGREPPEVLARMFCLSRNFRAGKTVYQPCPVRSPHSTMTMTTTTVNAAGVPKSQDEVWRPRPNGGLHVEAGVGQLQQRDRLSRLQADVDQLTTLFNRVQRELDAEARAAGVAHSLRLATSVIRSNSQHDHLNEDEDDGSDKWPPGHGWVVIAERLDVIFMTFFLVCVTIPVLILFVLTRLQG